MIFDKCSKFEYLLCESEDRSLTAKEQAFTAKHASNCPDCAVLQDSLIASMSLLRSSAMDYEADEHFESRVVRMTKLQLGRDSFAYWFPAILSAGIAAIAAFALMQLLSGTFAPTPFLFQGREARNSTQTIVPQLVYPRSNGERTR